MLVPTRAATTAFQTGCNKRAGPVRPALRPLQSFIEVSSLVPKFSKVRGVAFRGRRCLSAIFAGKPILAPHPLSASFVIIADDRKAFFGRVVGFASAGEEKW